MPTRSIRRGTHHAGRWLRRLLIITSVVLAVLVIALTLAMTQVNRAKPLLEAALAERLGGVIEIGEIAASWSGSGPELQLRELRRVNQMGDELRLPEISLGWQTATPWKLTPRQIQLRLSELQIERRTDGVWLIAGQSPLSEPGSERSLLDRLRDLQGEFSMVIDRVTVRAVGLDRNLVVAPLIVRHSESAGMGRMAVRGTFQSTLRGQASAILHLGDEALDDRGYLALYGVQSPDAAEELTAQIWAYGSAETWRWRGYHSAVADTPSAIAGSFDGARTVLGIESVDLARLNAVVSADTQALQHLGVTGEVSDIEVAWSTEAGLAVHGSFDDVAWQPTTRVPGVGGLAGEFRYQDDSWQVDLASTQSVLDWPAQFRQPWVLSPLRASVALESGDGWQVQVQLDEAGVADGHLQAMATIEANGGRPRLSVAAQIEGARARHTRAFLPIGATHPALVKYLDESVDDGEVRWGRVLIDGDLDHWPFADRSGVFLVDSGVDGVSFDYAPGWPGTAGLAARLRFDARSMQVIASAGTSGALSLQSATAAIANLNAARLRTDFTATATPAGAIQWLSTAPLALDVTLADFAVEGGQVSATTSLELDFRRGGVAVEYQGLASVTAQQASSQQWQTDLQAVTGQAVYDDEHFAIDLAGQRLGVPATVAVTIDEAGTHAKATANVEQQAWLRAYFGDAVTAITEPLDGNSRWSVDYQQPADSPSWQLVLQSDLVGTASQLPAPLTKETASELPIEVTLRGQPPGLDVEIEVARRGRGELSIENIYADRLQVDLAAALGAAQADPWLPIFAGGEGDGRPIAGTMRIESDATELAGRQWGAMATTVRFDDAQAWEIDTRGERVSGRLQMSTAGIRGAFDRLWIPAANSDSDGSEPTARQAIDPTAIPDLEVTILDARLDVSELGAVQIKTLRRAEGMLIERLTADSPAMRLQASGTWLATPQAGGASDLSVEMTTDNLGAMLASLGYADVIEDAPSTVEMVARWPGAPTQFSLSSTSGQIGLDIGPGRLLEVEPGAGRVFGLTSLQGIPRRLILDFSDLSEDGLAFDAISGVFTLTGGQAETPALAISGPAVDLLISGSTDLLAQRFEQQVQVDPHFGVALPVLGAIAGGAPGAAAAVALQSVMNSAVNARRYRLHGPWQSPQFERLDGNPSEPLGNEVLDRADAIAPNGDDVLVAE